MNQAIELLSDDFGRLDLLVLIERRENGDGGACVCLVNGATIVPKGFLRESLWMAASFCTLRPGVAV